MSGIRYSVPPINSDVISGPRENETRVASSPDHIQKLLIDEWKPIYQACDINTEKADMFLRTYVNQQNQLFQFENISELSIDDFKSYVSVPGDGQPGPNGIPYSAYRVVPDLSARVLHATFRQLCSSNSLLDLEEFNRTLVWFAPKGNEPGETIEAIRNPGNLRTIFGGNSDSKLISGTLAHKLTSPTLTLTPFIQRGFCRGRQLALNVVDLDIFTRVFNCEADVSDPLLNIGSIPATVLYDFANAFPSLCHQWLFKIFTVIGIPNHLIVCIRNLYSDILAFSSGVGTGEFLFKVERGVKIGCPLSSILFLLAINPFVYLFQWLSDGPGLSATRVCADDFGSALKELSVLKIQNSIFKLVSPISGLHLKPSKCVLIISCHHLTPQLIEAIRVWLAAHVPGFVSIRIESHGKYLGWHVGDSDVFHSFRSPVSKYKKRVVDIVEGAAAVFLALQRYNQRAVTVLSLSLIHI